LFSWGRVGNLAPVGQFLFKGLKPKSVRNVIGER
jgi:hypothetical protein